MAFRNQNVSNIDEELLSVHDPEFKTLMTIPRSAVHHLPPAHLEISRLVLCRKYDAKYPEDSCPKGTACKFVHADVNSSEVVTQSIHVNYAWRSLEEVVYNRLPPGEAIEVTAPNKRPPTQYLPTEIVLATKGALNRHSARGPLSHCAHYYFNRMCNRGDRCNFIHTVHLDPNAAPFQRAPRVSHLEPVQEHQRKKEQPKPQKSSGHKLNREAAPFYVSSASANPNASVSSEGSNSFVCSASSTSPTTKPASISMPSPFRDSAWYSASTPPPQLIFPMYHHSASAFDPAYQGGSVTYPSTQLWQLSGQSSTSSKDCPKSPLAYPHRSAPIAPSGKRATKESPSPAVDDHGAHGKQHFLSTTFDLLQDDSEF